MADYMVQTMRSGNHQAIIYYRKYLKRPETRGKLAFTRAAKTDYAATAGVAQNQIEVGDLQINQAKPTGEHTKSV